MSYAHLVHVNGEIADVDYEQVIESKDGFQLTYGWLRETHDGENVAEIRDGCWYVLAENPPRPYSDISFSDESPKLVAAGARAVNVYVWKANADTGYLDKVRTKIVREVFDELREILGEYPDGGDEYFSCVFPAFGAEWPDGDIVCFSVNGTSEGDYCHVEIHQNGHRELIFLGKTFQGRDASWAFARRLADLLEIQ